MIASPRASPKFANAANAAIAIPNITRAILTSIGSKARILPALAAALQYPPNDKMLMLSCSPLRRGGRRGEVSAAAAGEELAGLVEHLCLGGRELAAHAHHLAAHNEVARHRGAVIVDPQVDGRHAAAG